MSHLSMFINFLKPFVRYKNKNAILMVSKKKIFIFVIVGLKNPSLAITVCHQSEGLVMPNGDIWDKFFYPFLTLMIDYYINTQV